MSAVHLPWESLPGPVYTARPLKPRKKWVSVGGWILSTVLIVGGIFTPYRILIVFGILYLLTMLSAKDTVVTSRGVEIFYQMRITTHYDFVSWSNIESVVREGCSQPGMVSLYFAHGNRVKRLYFFKTDAEQILTLAKEQNPGIKLAESNGTPIVIPKKKKTS